MINAVQNLLSAPELLVKKIEEANADINGHSAIEWNPMIKWNYSSFVEIEDAFASLLYLWLKTQKEYAGYINPENKEKTDMALLIDLFGVSKFSDLEIEEVNGQDCFNNIGKRLIGDYYDEKLRLKELGSLKKAKGLAIKCKTGDILYFGKTQLFYFLVSNASLTLGSIPVLKEIHEILFSRKICESARKRPGMYTGSANKQGLYRMLFGLIEELLEDALEKNLSFKILPQDMLEITCESYFVKNNTSHFNYIPIVNALSETFIWQDEKQEIRTKKGVLTATAKEKGIADGVRMVWKPDVSIFKDIHLDYYIILNRMIELAALNPYRISLANEQNQNTVSIPSGIEALIKMGTLATREIIPISISDNAFNGEIALFFTCVGMDIRKSYINNQITQDGGTHVEGVLRGAKKALKKILSSYGNGLSPDNFMDNLNYVIHIKIKDPRWHGSTKRRLKNLEVKSIIQERVEEKLYTFLRQDIQPLQSIYPNCFDREIAIEEGLN